METILTKEQQRRIDAVPQSGKTMYLKAITGKCPPRAAIKVMCLECIGWSRKEITNCTSTACPLYAYRPFQKSEDSLPEAEFED